ncbi:DUF1990 domain-containing protein [Gordonia sp. PP30]|uniref:DUF1990 family protein n=1 Tax=unclassified Gordonia (in: high G+C Gram-positive bacteria) TaxID=2657482 RepID=UPI001FFFEDA1|nr:MULTISPECIES: DUF1990 domain-containing protein [unclassified Gordonia (in: high G+C Gram-positive bacteria)]UQE73496.1 DUF1990 domain-containing protein [Gordonia sp. PP30]
MTTRRPGTLGPDRVRALGAAPFTYSAVGAACGGAVPTGFHGLYRCVVIGHGDDAFATAGEALLTWQVQLRSGIRVCASSPRIAPGAVATVGVGVGPLRMTGPVRVLDVTEAPSLRAFSYGTLPGHPECGEERFAVALDEDGTVRFELTGFSRHVSRLARLGAPVARFVQRVVTDRYARSLIVAPSPT